ncbi:B-cell receptor CD22-like [Ornithodoros turicata]|uniref:B-cell receptor CD22-like n=1 Tax=Ornithodoros turicata TaxID=34597 RepID=UPI003138B89A
MSLLLATWTLTLAVAYAWTEYGNAGYVNEITVVTNQTGKLYCNTTVLSGSNDENPSQIRWYKGAELIYMLTSDGRNVPVRQMTHRPSATWKDRLQLRATRLPIWLSINMVNTYDQGHYHCHVYYGNDLKRNITHFLKVIEPPHGLVVLAGRLRQVRLQSNEYVNHSEGEDLYLECRAIGGKPDAHIRWLEDPLKENSSSGRAVLIIPKVPRHLDNGVFTCEASNSNITGPLQTSVSLRLNLKPVNVTIRNKNTPLKAGVLARVECESYGSRPAPHFSWWLDGKELNSSRIVENDLSVLFFRPTVQNNRQTLTCIARNPLIKSSKSNDVWNLDVQYKPQVNLLYQDMKVAKVNVTHGTPISLDCTATGNPAATSITWCFNHRPLRRMPLYKSGYFTRDGTRLDILNPGRNHTGVYTCMATNDLGNSTSNELFLRVLYEPECARSSDDYITGSINDIIKVPCKISAEPSDVKFHWLFKSSTGTNVTTRNLTSNYNSSSNGVLLYSPKIAADFGTIHCWAENEIGKMKKPCVFHIVLFDLDDSVVSYVLVAVIVTVLFVLILVAAVIGIVIQTRTKDVRKKGLQLQTRNGSQGNSMVPKSLYGDHSV